jgi:hypothetical protein
MGEASLKASGSRIHFSRAVRAVLVLCLLVVIGFRVYGYFASSATETALTPRESLATEDLGQWRDALSKAFAAQDWELAAEACDKLVGQETDNMGIWMRLAYSQHMLGRFDQAIAAYLRVCQWEGRPRQWALYNISRAYAKQGEKQQALNYLQDAVEAGFRQRSDEPSVADEADFRSIADDPEFQRLAELSKPISKRNVYRQMDFLLGQWALLSGDERRIGSAEFSAATGGYTIVGECTDNTRAKKYTLLAYYHPATSRWRQTWLDDQGGVIDVTGTADVSGESFALEGEVATADGRTFAARVVFDEAADGAVHLAILSSSDGGARWTDILDATLVPVRAKPESDAASS